MYRPFISWYFWCWDSETVEGFQARGGLFMLRSCQFGWDESEPRKYRAYLLNTYRKHTECILNAYRMHTKHKLNVYWTRTKCILNAYQTHTECVLYVYRMHTEHVLNSSSNVPNEFKHGWLRIGHPVIRTLIWIFSHKTLEMYVGLFTISI